MPLLSYIFKEIFIRANIISIFGLNKSLVISKKVVKLKIASKSAKKNFL